MRAGGFRVAQALCAGRHVLVDRAILLGHIVQQARGRLKMRVYTVFVLAELVAQFGRRFSATRASLPLLGDNIAAKRRNNAHDE